LKSFELAARSHDAALRAANVATLVDALDLCNLLVLGDRIVFDMEVGGGRDDKVLGQIDRVAKSLADPKTADDFRASFSGVAPANVEVSTAIQLQAARGSTAFFPRLARCATSVLDLFPLPHCPPTDPEKHLLPHVTARSKPTRSQIEQLESQKGI